MPAVRYARCPRPRARVAPIEPHADPFAGLEPIAFWRHLEALIAIPRPSYEEDAAVAHVVAWADARGHPTRRDAAGNLVVQVPATPGRERAKVVILQGHLDIVCEGVGPIRVVRDGEWVRAEATTLGADNGVAIAAMLALVESGAPHGPLELLMTVAEEVGMAGAAELDPALITGGVLLNLDSEEDATLTVGCAGGADTVVRCEAPREPLGAGAVRVTVSGGRGGHSGGDIAAGRANAIKLLGRALAAEPRLRIASLDGGSSRNAIPRDAVAVVAGDAEAIARAGKDAAAAYASTDPGVRVTVEPVAAPAGAWTADASARIVDLIAAIPHGPLGMSVGFPGVVETSSSLSVAATQDGRLTLTCLSRSANDARIPEVTGAIAAAARLAGAGVEAGRRYPGWLPDLESPVLATATVVHERLFGAPPHVSLTHGGLETAVIGARKPGLDMISFGPQIEGPHAPGERLHVASAERFVRLLAALADELSR